MLFLFTFNSNSFEVIITLKSIIVVQKMSDSEPETLPGLFSSDEEIDDFVPPTESDSSEDIFVTNLRLV